MAADDPERPVLLALVGWIRYVIRENRKVAARLDKEPEFMQTMREGFEQWMETERQRIDTKLRERAKQEGLAQGLTQGLTQGLAQGLAKGKAESLLKVLAARRIVISKKLRKQIVGCTDEAQLDRWIEQAASAGSAAELSEVN